MLADSKQEVLDIAHVRYLLRETNDFPNWFIVWRH